MRPILLAVLLLSGDALRRVPRKIMVRRSAATTALVGALVAGPAFAATDLAPPPSLEAAAVQLTRDGRGAGSDSDSPPRPSLEVAAVQLKRDAGAAGAESYFDDAHPEFLVGLVVHWLLWGYAPRPVALAYDFGGVALLAAEGFLG